MSVKQGKYYKLYRYYKNQCSLLDIKNKKMEAMIQSCRALLDCNTLLSPVMSSTPNTSWFPTKRNISFSIHESSSDSCDTMMDTAGANKWECLSDGERERLIKYEAEEAQSNNVRTAKSNENSRLPQQAQPEQSDHACETLYESAIATNGMNQPVQSIEKCGSSPKRLFESPEPSFPSNLTDETFFESAASASAANEGDVSSDFTLETPKKKMRPATPEPPQQQGKVRYRFYISSVRKQAKLSPESRKWSTTTRENSPTNSRWSLDMPSTQFIRSRNQSPDPEN